MKKLWISILGVSLFYGLMASSISLSQSIDLAKENNLEILAEQASTRAATWQKKSALGNLLPQVSFNSTIVRIDKDSYEAANEPLTIPGLGTFPSMFPVYETTYTNNITVTQSLFNGGKVILGSRLAKLAERQAIESLQSKSGELELQVTTTYFNLLKLYDLKNLSLKSIESTRAHLNSVKNQYRAGTARETDVLQWQVKLQQDQTTLSEVETSVRTVSLLWQNLLGSEELMLPKAIEEEEIEPVLNYYTELKENSDKALIDYLQSVKDHNPELKILNLNRKMMKTNYTMAQGSFLPGLNLQYTYQFESDDKFDLAGDDNWNIAALLSIPLFTGGKNYSDLKSAAFQKKQIDFQTAHYEEQLFIAAESSFLKTINKANSVMDNRLVTELALANYEQINELAEQGMVTNTELQDADIMLYSSQMSEIASFYDFLILTSELSKWEGGNSKQNRLSTGLHRTELQDSGLQGSGLQESDLQESGLQGADR